MQKSSQLDKESNWYWHHWVLLADIKYIKVVWCKKHLWMNCISHFPWGLKWPYNMNWYVRAHKRRRCLIVTVVMKYYC